MGRAAALAFPREGARVWATALDPQKLQTLGAHERLLTRRPDVLSPAQINEFWKEIDGPDILFNCAGFVHNDTILDCDGAFSTFASVRISVPCTE
jgi:2-keto-3-deoxy-L-fuconate dehydrogenase